jgi:O-antigen/teichoic acid export membrane protein
MANFSIGNHISFVFYNLPVLILPIMILNMISAKFAGYFYIAIMMASLLYGISGAISNSLLAESSDKKNFVNTINSAIKFNFIILIPGTIFFLIFGKIVLNIFSPDYAENAALTLTILCMTSLPLSLVGIFTTVRTAQKRIMSAIKMDMFTALITVILSIPLIRIMGIEGAAISYLVANIAGALIVVSKLNDPKEFTLTLLGDIRRCIA